MKIGDSVDVKVKPDDVFSHNFVGTIMRLDNYSLRVVDCDGDVFDVDYDQVKPFGEVQDPDKVQGIKLTEKQMVEKAMEFLGNCDADELARIIGDMYGVDCFTGDDDTYEATPNENYCGGLDDLKKCAIVESTQNHQ